MIETALARNQTFAAEDGYEGAGPKENTMGTESRPDDAYTSIWSRSGEIEYAKLTDGTRLRYLKAGSGPARSPPPQPESTSAFGLYAATITVALLLAALGDRAMSDDVAIGTILAWLLGLGVFFLDLFNQSSSGGNGITAARTLYGSIFGLSTHEAGLAAIVGAALILGILLIARPLLFATIDPRVAAARGLPVAALGTGFLVLVGVDAALTTQIVGALLMLGLIAVPAGAAHRLTGNAYLALGLSSAFALASLWLGVLLAYQIPTLPPSSAIIGVAAAIYGLCLIATFRPGKSAHASNIANGGRLRST
jgi:zinc/manganese transport system permease protein